MMRLIVLLKRLPTRLAIAAAPILRMLSGLAFLVAVIALVNDWVLKRPAMSVAQLWKSISPSSYLATGKAISAGAGEWVWTGLIGAPLALPAYFVFGALAIALGYAGRRRRQVNVYLN